MKLGSEPAFPQTIDDMGTIRSMTQGMTRRQWLVGMALQGLVACSNAEGTLSQFARYAHEYADAILEHEQKEVSDGKRLGQLGRL